MKPDTSELKKQEDAEDPIRDLEKSLYSRGQDFSAGARSDMRLRKHDLEVQKDWEGDGVPEARRAFVDTSSRMTFLKKFFIFSVVFFLTSIAVAAYVVFGGGNVVSSNNVDIAVVGSVSVAGGEILPLEITVTNQNNTDIDSADLVIDYPEGTRQAEDMTAPLKRYREALGPIPKGGTVTKKVQSVLFGQEGNIKDLTISVEYRVQGLNPVFRKEKKYSVALSSSPVTMTVESVKEINANQDAEFTVTVVSNASAVIQNLALAVDYPFGFTFSGAEPKSSWSNSFWRLGDLKPGVKRVIKVRGTVAGQDNEDRVFKFSVGTENPSNDSVIGTNFLTALQTISIRKPFIGTTLALDGDTGDTHVARAGKKIRSDVQIVNNVGTRMTDIKVAVKINGGIFDSTSVSLTNGFYRSYDQTILWDQTLKPELAVLNPDDMIPLSFTLGVLPEAQLRAMNSPEMTVAVTVTGKRLNETGISQEVSSTVTKKVRVPSSLGLTTRSLYFTGPFRNTGPIPPQVDKDTSYTVVWSLTNGSTDLSHTKVVATLPSYVKWLSISSPSSERISYNPVGGQVVWDVGDLPAGTGFSSVPREVSFQISLTPGLSQLGSWVMLVGEATASGDDSFAEQTVTVTSSSALTTELTTDNSWKNGQGTVVQ